MILWVFGPDGLLIRWEGFDRDCAAEAVARFDELTAAPVPARTVARRLRPNAASAHAARFAAAFAAGDADAVAALWTDDLEVIDHPNAASYARDGHLASIRRLQRARDPKLTFEPLATLGDALCLTRRCTASQGTAGARFDVGASEHEALVLFEVDPRGPCRRLEIFAVGHLNDAVVRLYERYAELVSDDAASAHAIAATAGAVAALLASTIDEEALRGIRALDALADVTILVQDILVLDARVLLLRTMLRGTDRASGGLCEMPALALLALGSDGRLVRYEIFDVGHEVDALARLDAIGASTALPAAPGFANAATRCFDAYVQRWHARDWEGVLATLVPRLVDHRALTGLDLEGEDLVRNVRHMFGFGDSHWTVELLATRGERLALSRLCFAGRGSDRDAGMSEVEFVDVYAIDATGRPLVSVLFDSADLAAAYAELEARWEAGEAASHPRTAAAARAMALAWTRRDWNGVEALCTPSFVSHDHRLLGWGTLPDAAAWVRTQRALVDLAPDVRIRHDHVRTCERGCLVQLLQEGTRDGGAFERAFTYVAELDDAGRFVRYDVYDADRADQARARFAELSTARPE